MINKLNKLLKTKTMCEIYADTNNTDKFIVGYVSGVDDEFCLITNFGKISTTSRLGLRVAIFKKSSITSIFLLSNIYPLSQTSSHIVHNR